MASLRQLALMLLALQLLGQATPAMSAEPDSNAILLERLEALEKTRNQDRLANEIENLKGGVQDLKKALEAAKDDLRREANGRKEALTNRLNAQDKLIEKQGDFVTFHVPIAGMLVTIFLFLGGVFAYYQSAQKSKEQISKWLDKNLDFIMDVAREKMEAQVEPILARIKELEDSAIELHDNIRKRAQEQFDPDGPKQKPDGKSKGPDAELKDEIRKLAEKARSKPESARTAQEWTDIAMNNFMDDKLKEAAEALAHVLSMSEAPAKLRAQALFNRGVVFDQLGQHEESRASYQALLTEFKNAREPNLREFWAQGAFNMINDYVKAEDIPAARALLDDLRRLADENPKEANLREFWASGAVNMINAYGKAKDIPAARALLEELRRLADDNPKEANLRDLWAGGAFNMINAYGKAKDIPAVRALFDDLRKMMQDHQDEPQLREKWASGAFSMIIHYSDVNDIPAARALLDDLRKLADENPKEPNLRKWVAQGLNSIGFNSIMQLKEKTPATSDNVTPLDLAPAVADLTEALKILPDGNQEQRAMILGNIAYATFLSGDRESAEKPLREALRLGGEKTRDGELEDADIHPLGEMDEAFKALVNRLWAEVSQEESAETPDPSTSSG
ncbi:tetratricopeptide repeat protein [Magnetospira thiophila]